MGAPKRQNPPAQVSHADGKIKNTLETVLKPFPIRQGGVNGFLQFLDRCFKPGAKRLNFWS
jgi:hypothetical protein